MKESEAVVTTVKILPGCNQKIVPIHMLIQEGWIEKTSYWEKHFTSCFLIILIAFTCVSFLFCLLVPISSGCMNSLFFFGLIRLFVFFLHSAVCTLSCSLVVVLCRPCLVFWILYTVNKFVFLYTLHPDMKRVRNSWKASPPWGRQQLMASCLKL